MSHTTKEILISISFFIFAYVLGSISPSFIITKLVAKKDIREIGSKNAGSTNTMRAIGKGWAVLVLALDVLKGLIPTLVGKHICTYGMEIGMLGAVLGHDFSICLKFKGGKGIATSFGAMIIINYKISLAVAVIWLCVIIISRYVSLGSIIAALSLGVFGMLRYITFNNTLAIAILFISLLAVGKHHKNIEKLIKKEEKKVFEKK